MFKVRSAMKQELLKLGKANMKVGFTGISTTVYI